MKYLKYLLLLTLLCSTYALAIESVFESDADEDVLELDLMQISVHLQEEAAMRMIRQALNTPKSGLEAERDTLICRVEKELGSRIPHLTCARNGDFWAHQPIIKNPQELFKAISRGQIGALNAKAGYGKLLRSSKPINRAKLKQLMASLDDSSYFDNDFASLVYSGKSPPENVPEESELIRFSKAWVKIENLRNQKKAEDLQISAISEEHLSLNRYNRISEMVDAYPSMKHFVAEQVGLIR